LVQLNTDQCIFKTADNNLYLAIHVDDGLIVAKNERTIEKLVQGLENEFEMIVTNEPRTYLGMEISQNDTSILLARVSMLNKSCRGTT